MKWALLAAILLFSFYSCDYFSRKKYVGENLNRIVLRSDTLNSVRLSDTLMIFESVCRGCAYEQSTNFVLFDSLNLVELHHIETHDDNPDNMAGGSINKNLIIFPRQTGITRIKVYMFLQNPTSKGDSTNYIFYNIKITK